MKSLALCVRLFYAPHVNGIKRANRRAFRTAGAILFVKQEGMLGPHAVFPFRLQTQHMLRASRYTTPAAGAAVVINNRNGFTRHDAGRV